MKPLQHILCVDDEEDILEVMKLCLEMTGGFEVSCCRSGFEALERVGSIRPDMILLDVMMPGLDGPATFARLRARADVRDIPVVFATASVRPSQTEHYAGLGASGFLAKPFDPATFASQVEAIWSGIQDGRAGQEEAK